MKTRKLAVMMILALSVAALGTEAFAAGPGGGGLRKRDGSCVRTTTQTSQQVRNRTATKTSLQAGANGAAKSTLKGTAQGQTRRLGPGDGTGNVTRPLDGTGYGSPATTTK